MTHIDIRPAVPLTLQDIADQLAASLNRPATVREGAGAVRHGGVHARDHSPGSPAQIEMPVLDGGAVVARVAVPADGYPPLTPLDFEALDAASALIRDMLRGERGTDRDSMFHALLDGDETIRRAAFSHALEQRWLHHEQGTVVRALLVDAALSDVHSIAFARHLAHLRPVPLHFVTLRRSMLVLVSQPSDRAIEDVIFQEAARRGIRILGIGSASPARGAQDLAGAADEAAIAASLAAALPQFHPAVDASELGGWLLLASATADPAHLHLISPAAHELYTHGDESQRVTVETYLDVGSNVVAACEILFVHRTTLYYRLERMPEIVRDALADGIKRSTLHVALKLIRLWEATGRV